MPRYSFVSPGSTGEAMTAAERERVRPRWRNEKKGTTGAEDNTENESGRDRDGTA